jgi:two-component system, response regulator PdtaR
MTPSPTRPPSILIAEDESLLRMVTADMFEAAGYHVIEVGSGDEGAGIVADGRDIAGLITDIQMPGLIDGVALARITHEQHPDAVIIVVSGQCIPKAGELPTRAAFIGKPYDARHLLNTLNGMLA